MAKTPSAPVFVWHRSLSFIAQWRRLGNAAPPRARRFQPVISTTDAALLLNISPRRVRALCLARRISGARLLGRDWRIPLRNGAISITPGKRGPARPSPEGPGTT